MALGLEATLPITSPVEEYSLVYLQVSSTPTISSKAPRVPEPASRPNTAISPSVPPSSDQLVISPVKI